MNTEATTRQLTTNELNRLVGSLIGTTTDVAEAIRDLNLNITALHAEDLFFLRGNIYRCPTCREWLPLTSEPYHQCEPVGEQKPC